MEHAAKSQILNRMAGAVANVSATEHSSSRVAVDPGSKDSTDPASAAVNTAFLRHSAVVRITHWLTALSFLALLVTGAEILVSHPRFYWGETGNINTPALFTIPIPTSRDTIPNGYSYTLPDQNGWSRYLHFESAWLLVLTGLAYLAFGFARGHFRTNLAPAFSDLAPRKIFAIIARHLRLRKLVEAENWSYNPLQRLTYLAVIFILCPLVIWTGLAMSPGVVSAFPSLVTFWGGQQSARTVHFLMSGLLALFLFVHVLMVGLSGFRNRMRAMITGRYAKRMEQL